MPTGDGGGFHAAQPDYRPATVWGSYKAVLSNATCLGYMLVLAFGFGSHLAYVTGSSLSMMAAFGFSAHGYALFFGVAAFGIMLASFVSGRLNARGISGSLLVAVGLTIALLSASVMLTLALMSAATAARIIPLLILNTFCFGLIMPNAQQAVLEPMPSISGAASALINATMMAVGAFASYLVQAIAVHDAVTAMAGAMAVFSGLAWVTFLLTRARERSRAIAALAR